MAKKPSLTQQLSPQRRAAATVTALSQDQAEPLPEERPTRQTRAQKGRIGKTNFTAYGPPEAKYALEEIALQRKRDLGRRVTLEELMFEAFNDFLMKSGKPALFPIKSDG